MDRLVAAVAVVVVGGALVVCLAVADEPLTREQLHDPAAAAALVARLRAGEQRSSVVRYAVTRERVDGALLPSTIAEARSPNVQLTRSGGTLGIQTADATYDCELVDEKPQCFRKGGGFGLPLSAVLQAAIDAAPYDVLWRGSTTIAGEHADCYSLTAHVPTRLLPDLGRRAVFCVTADGIVVRSDLDGRLARERHVAEKVVRAFDNAALEPLLTGFGTVLPDFRR